MLASVIIDRVRNTLLDPLGDAWVDSELLDYLSAGQTAICQEKPDAYTIRTFIALAVGASQQLPTDGLQIFDITQNEDGSVVNQVGRELLNATSRTWMASSNEAMNVDEFMTDERDPRRFFVNPPNNGYGAVECLYGAVPPTISSLTDSLVVKDTYETALWAYVVALAYGKNSKRQDMGKFSAFYSIFESQIGKRKAAQAAMSPKIDPTERPG